MLFRFLLICILIALAYIHRDDLPVSAARLLERGHDWLYTRSQADVIMFVLILLALLVLER
jgi:hypothetical protein